MSLSGKRAEIAHALSTVAGVHGYEKRPDVPVEGDAWPLFGPAERDAGTAFAQTWGIRVIVPQDEYAAADWWDLHWTALFYALEPIGHVTRSEPVTFPVNGTDVLAFQITMIAEE